MNKRRSIWLSLSLVNLCLVAFFGFTLRSKILFSLPFVDFRSVESAHSHFAFAGWVGLSLMTLFVYDLLPESLSRKPIYQWLLAGVERLAPAGTDRSRSNRRSGGSRPGACA